MAKIETRRELVLSIDTIDEISKEVENFCEKVHASKKEKTRLRLSIEECLGIWLQELAGEEEKTVILETGKKFFKPYVQLSIKGNRCNPYKDHDDGFGVAGKSMLINLGLVPMFSYRLDENDEGYNNIFYYVKKQEMNQLLKLLIVIGFAVLVSLLGKLFLSPDFIASITEGFISPIEDTFFHVLSCIAGPMVFLSIAWGVYGIGDVYTLGRIGKNLFVGFMLIILAFTILGSFAYPLLGPTFTETEIGTSQFGNIFNMILGIFPSNIITPFSEGNTLQIIFLGFIIGLSLIFLGKRTASVAVAIDQVNNIITFLMNIISQMVPYFVFIVLVRLVWSGDLEKFTEIWKLVAVFLPVYFGLLILFLIYTSINNRVSPFKLLKDTIPSYLIALTTASSAATFESNNSILTNKLKVKRSMASFSVPFGMVTFKPNTALYYLLLCFYLAGVYNVNTSISWIVIAIIVISVCAVATPPIPGGSAATYTILFLQLGIPESALAVALAVDMIIDFFMTSGDMFSLNLEILNASKRTGMIEATEGKLNKN